MNAGADLHATADLTSFDPDVYSNHETALSIAVLNGNLDVADALQRQIFYLPRRSLLLMRPHTITQEDDDGVVEEVEDEENPPTSIARLLMSTSVESKAIRERVGKYL